jgi:type IV secretion system protein TrbL
MKKLSTESLLCIGMALLLAIFVLAPESQALPTNNFLDEVVNTYQSKTSAWEGVLRNFALRLFWILAAIEFTWSSIKLAIKGADISEFFAELLNRIMYIGVFLTLLLNSSAWSTAIVDSFRQAASAAVSAAGGTPGISPSNVLDAGWLILKQVVASMRFWQSGDLILIALAAIVILIGFALMTALLICALVESYMVISSGVILMGFGGSQWTNEFATNTIRYAVSVGAKLFMTQLVIGLGESLLLDWSAQMQAGDFGIDDVMMIAAASLVFVAITKVIPEMVQGLISGSSFATGGALSGMVAEAIGTTAAVSAGLASGGASSAAGAAAVAHGSYNLASETLKSDPNYQRGSSRAHFAALTGEAIKGTVSHIGGNLGQRFRGEIRHGNPGAQVGYSMNQEAAKLRELRQGEQQTSRATQASSSANSNRKGGSTSANRLYPQPED